MGYRKETGIVKESTCKSCGAKIIFIRTRSGKMMPCDPDEIFFQINSDSRKLIVTAEGNVINARLNVPAAAADGLGFNPHWATCPDASRFRRRK